MNGPHTVQNCVVAFLIFKFCVRIVTERFGIKLLHPPSLLVDEQNSKLPVAF
jgi:hypothetical protein